MVVFSLKNIIQKLFIGFFKHKYLINLLNIEIKYLKFVDRIYMCIKLFQKKKWIIFQENQNLKYNYALLY